jgi:hypothetical protein
MLIRRDGLMASSYGPSPDFVKMVSSGIPQLSVSPKAAQNAGDGQLEQKKAEYLAKLQAAGMSEEAARAAIQKFLNAQSGA